MDRALPADVAALRAIAPIKTWSLVVTALGDAGAGPSAPVASADLAQICDAAGIQAAALRVALHRLSKDGWVGAQKTGRTSAYFLTDKGQAATQAVRAQIYDPGFDGLAAWWLWMFERPPAIDLPRHVVLNATTIATLTPTPPDGAAGVRVAGDVPDWIVTACLPAPLAQGVADLTAAARATSPAARLLTLHHWRRIALRDGFWLLKALRPHGPEAQCQRAVHAVL